MCGPGNWRKGGIPSQGEGVGGKVRLLIDRSTYLDPFGLWEVYPSLMTPWSLQKFLKFIKRNKSFRHLSISTLCNLCWNPHCRKSSRPMPLSHSKSWETPKWFWVRSKSTHSAVLRAGVWTGQRCFRQWAALLSPCLEDNQREFEFLSLWFPRSPALDHGTCL